MSFGNNLKELRKKKGLSQEELAEKLFVTRQAISKWESDAALPDLDKIKSIAKFFDVSIDELVNGEAKEKKEKVHSNSTSDKVDDFINSIALGIKKVAKMVSVKNTNEIIRFIFEVFIILLIIMLFKIPFIMIEDLGRGLFAQFERVGIILTNFWELIFELSYAILAVIAFVYIFKIRYLDDFDEKEFDIKNEKKINEKKIQAEAKAKNEKKKTEVREEEVVTVNGFVDILLQICLIFLKIICGSLAFAFGIGILCLLVMFAYSIYLITLGIDFIGVMLVLLGASVFLILLFVILINFIFNNKNSTGSIIFNLIFSFILVSAGVVIGTIEFSAFTYINENREGFVTLEEYTFDYNNMLYVEDDYFAQYVVDNTLGDKVKIEVSYPSIYGKVYVTKNDNEIEIEDIAFNSFNLKEILDIVIEDLKNKTIYNYDDAFSVKVYGNETVIETIRKNSYYNRMYD